MKETIRNLARAFIGESQARNRYTYYSKTARNEGYQQIAELFLITADNEKEHAKWLMRLINQLKETTNEDLSELAVEGAVPTIMGTTEENLKAAIAGETYEFTEMYPAFADQADADGLPEIANRLRAIAKAEEHHNDRYTKLLKEVQAGTVFKKSEPVTWVCRECGYIHVGNEPPLACPSCGHPTAYFQIKAETY